MTRNAKTYVAIAVLLMALFTFTGCSPSAGTDSASSTAVSAMRAMAQAIDTANTATGTGSVEKTGNTYTVREFTADDGTKITGNFETDASGNIIDATLELHSTKGQVLTFVLSTEGGADSVMIDDTPVPPSSLPSPMTREQNAAFGAFLIGFDEAFDEVKDILEESLERYEKRPAGTYAIEGIDGMTGTVTVAREPGDDDMEIIAADISSFDIAWRGTRISGSYSFSERGNEEKERVSLRIENFQEREDGLNITLSDVSIDAEINEGEIRDDDIFSFSGSIGGKFSVSGKSHEVSFRGDIEAREDAYFRFPSYTLMIDGEDVAIGRQEKNTR